MDCVSDFHPFQHCEEHTVLSQDKKYFLNAKKEAKIDSFNFHDTLNTMGLYGIGAKKKIRNIN